MKVLIIDDDISFVTDIRRRLEALGIKSVRMEYTESGALNAIREYEPDLVICDIVLDGKESGLDLSKELSDKHIAFIIVTQFKNEDYYETIIRFKPIAYFTKPIDNMAFRYTIKNLINERMILPMGTEFLGNSQNRYLFIKKMSKYQKVNFSDICFIYAEGNYATIECVNDKYVIKSSLKKCMLHINGDSFIQAHRNYFVNLHFIRNVDLGKNKILIKNQEIPLGRSFRLELKNKLPTL